MRVALPVLPEGKEEQRDAIPVGEEGVWELLAKLSMGEGAQLDFAPGQSLAAMAEFFHFMARVCELGAGAGRLANGGELATVVLHTAAERGDVSTEIAAEAVVEPLARAAYEGRAFLHEGCGHLWQTDGESVVDSCPCCHEAVYHVDAGAAAEDVLEVDGPYTKMAKGDAWF